MVAQNVEAVKPIDATVEAEGDATIRSVNKGKRRGRKAGETMQLLQIGGTIRRFAKKELGGFYLACAISDGDVDAMETLLQLHGRPLPVVPDSLDISDWSKNDYLTAIARVI